MSEEISVADSLRKFRGLRELMMVLETTDESGEQIRVSTPTMSIFRREYEIVKTALWFPCEMTDCGIHSEQMEVRDYRSAWAAIQSLVASGTVKPGDRVPSGPFLYALAEGYKGSDNHFSMALGDAWLGWMILGHEPVLSYGLNVLVPAWFARARLREQRRHYEQLVGRIDQESDPHPLQRDWQDEASRTLNEPDGNDVGMTVSTMLDRHDELDKGGRNLVPLGLPRIDHANGGGVGRGDLCVVGGGTSHGKSYLAERMLRLQAEMKRHSLYVSIEDDEDLMTARIIADFSSEISTPGASPAAIRSREADPLLVREAKRRATETMGEYVHYVQANKASVSEVCRLMRKARNLHKVDLVVVDYLQAVGADEPSNMRTNDVAIVVSSLKKCAKEIGVALVLMSQYGREEYRDNAEPTINSCKWAGEIENEAEVMILLWRDESDMLHAKVAKLKWSRSAALRFLVEVDPYTGCLGHWSDDFKEPRERKDNKRPGRGSDKAN